MPTRAPEHPPTAIGRYIKAKREAAGLTQDGLADDIPFSQAAISAWELGIRIPTARAVAALARTLPDASVDEMLELIEQQDVAP